ncbi:MAG: Cytochrome c protein [Deltaproteobacteria bacterium]|nr:Cytochrome c protein [Deltaproteobacteria bacterium]MBM2838484.1 Cytochrome c protein [Deltaproteobacteria bacterium]
MKRQHLIVVVMSLIIFGGYHAATAGESGKALFERYCVKCHGEDGSVSEYGKNIKPNPARDLRTNRLFISPRELPIIIKYGVYGREMKAWKDVLNDDEVKDVAKYVRTLTYTPDLKNGGELFKLRCAVCHEKEGPNKKLFGAPDLDMTPLGDLEITRAVRFGRHGTMMFPKGSFFSNPEIADIVAYLMSIKK